MGTPLIVMFALWGLATVALAALLTYRSFLTRHEEDQIILSKGEGSFAAEQQDIVSKVSRLDGPIKVLAFTSGGLLIVCGVVWIWTGLSSL